MRNANHPRPRCEPRGQGEAEGFEAADRLLLCVLSQPIGEESVPDGDSRPPEHRFPGEEGTPIFTGSIRQKVRPWFCENCAYHPLVPLRMYIGIGTFFDSPCMVETREREIVFKGQVRT